LPCIGRSWPCSHGTYFDAVISFYRRFHFITIDPEKLDKNTGELVQLIHSQKPQKSLDGGEFDDKGSLRETGRV
jgi:hypothetical protein